MRVQSLIQLAIVLATASSYAAFPSNRQRNNLDKLVNRLLSDWHTPGMAIAIIDGENTWKKGYGFATLPNTPVTPDTLFYMGSTTKSFTAAAVSLLVDNDTTSGIEWSTPINTILPDDFVLSDPWATTHITIEDALSHRTGYPRHDFAWQQTQQEFVRAFRNLPMTAEPRTKWQYSNQMYTTVGYLIEVVTKSKLKDIFKNWLWAPLGMTSSYLSLPEARGTKRLAKPYWWNNKTQSYVSLPYADFPQAQGAGMCISTVQDYAKYLRVMINRAGPISAAGHRELIAPHMIELPSGEPVWNGPVWYGFGWESSILENEIVHWHSGAVDGFNAVMAFIPGRQFGFAITVNAEAPALNIIFWYILYEYFGVVKKARFDIEDLYRQQLVQSAQVLANAKVFLFPDIPSPPVPRPLPLEAYTGVYNHPAYHNVTLNFCNSTSTVTSTPCELQSSSIESLGIEVHAELEHVSGEWWLGRGFEDYHDATTASLVLRVQTEIVKGELVNIGIEFEEGLFIWFQKVS